MARIIIGITGGISAYRIPDLHGCPVMAMQKVFGSARVLLLKKSKVIITTALGQVRFYWDWSRKGLLSARRGDAIKLPIKENPCGRHSSAGGKK
jgi:hypothetical protein